MADGYWIENGIVILKEVIRIMVALRFEDRSVQI